MGCRCCYLSGVKCKGFKEAVKWVLLMLLFSRCHFVTYLRNDTQTLIDKEQTFCASKTYLKIKCCKHDKSFDSTQLAISLTNNNKQFIIIRNLTFCLYPAVGFHFAVVEPCHSAW